MARPLNGQPRFCLLLRQPNRADATYPLEHGEYHVGSAPTCRIRTDETLTAPSEAMLKVDQTGVWLLDVHESGVVTIGKSAPRGWRRLETYDPVVLRTLELELVPSTEAGTTSPCPEAEVPANVRAKAEDDIRMGIAGYWDFRERLFTTIDVNESEEASATYRRGHIALWTLLLVTTVTALSKVDLGLTVLAGVLVLGTVFRVPVAGRAVLTAYGVALLAPGFTRWELEEGIPEWAPEAITIGKTWTAGLGIVPFYLSFFLFGFAMMSLFFFALGWLVDYGLSTEPDGGQPVRRRICLSASGLALITLIVLPESGPRSWSTLAITCLPAALCVVWPWGPSQWIQRRQRHFHSADVWLLLRAAHPRSLRYWGGRVLAAGLALLPFLCFLNGVGIREHLSRPSDVIRTGDPPNVWFWATRGRSIRAADFASQTVELYGGAADVYPNPRALVTSLWQRLRENEPRDRIHQKAREDIGHLVGSQRVADPVHERPPWVVQNGAVHGITRELLAPLRLDAEQFKRLVSGSRSTRPPTLLALEPPTEGHGEGYAEVLWAWPLPEQWVERFGTYYHFWSIHLLACSVLGFVFLWRRGGESPLARWIGIWLLSQASSAFLTFGVFFMPSIAHELASGSRTGTFFQVVFAGLMLLGKMMRSTVLYLDLPFCLIWTHACWPTATGRPSGVWRRNLVILAKVALVAVLLLGFTRAVDSVLSAVPVGVWSSLVKRTQLIGLLVLVLFGWALRRSYFWKSEAPHLGWAPVIALITLIVSVRGMELALEPPVINGVMFWGAWIAGVVPFMLFGVLLRRNFLRVASARELTYVLMVLLVPCLVVATETLAHAVFRSVPFVTETGAEIFAIAGVAALLPLIHKGIEFTVGWLVMPKLWTLQAEIDHVLEAVVDTDGEAARRTEVARLFERLKITGYVFYARGQRSVFTRCLDHMTGASADALPISGALREFLGRRHHGFVDLQNVPFEWPYFFHQFELYRIEKATQCRYLLPIRLGKSVRGFLLLAGGRAERDICKQPAAEELGTLGVAAIHT